MLRSAGSKRAESESAAASSAKKARYPTAKSACFIVILTEVWRDRRPSPQPSPGGRGGVLACSPGAGGSVFSPLPMGEGAAFPPLSRWERVAEGRVRVAVADERGIGVAS